MFSRVMETLKLSKSQIRQLVNAYLQPDGENGGNGVISHFRLRIITVFSLGKGQEDKWISPLSTILGNL